MLDWINSHGIALLIGYYFLISVLGTMPELPPTAGYMLKWAYAASQAICGNMKNLMASLQQKQQQQPPAPPTEPKP